jgi:hypothetical protein
MPIHQVEESGDQVQRIQVELERCAQGKLVKIRLERYDECLGWYTSASLSLPLHQLALLEQAVHEMRACESSSEPISEKIIAFPGAIQTAD